jgi:diaminopimelate epimerase
VYLHPESAWALKTLLFSGIWWHKAIGSKDCQGYWTVMKFLKMHGLGNDFVILDFRSGDVSLTPDAIKGICNRNFGVGCDQLVVLEPAKEADVFARFYNSDGSESGACGNATRCVADIVMKETGHQSCQVQTRAGILPAGRADSGMVTVDMGTPKLEWQDIPLSEKRSDTRFVPIDDKTENEPAVVNMGNPHCVFFCAGEFRGDAWEDKQMRESGPYWEHHPLFPERTNMEHAWVLSRDKIRVKTWERGAGLTLACGSAACAVAVAAVRRDLTERRVEIVMDGGSLFIEWRESDNHVLMTGPVAYVFEGVFRG